MEEAALIRRVLEGDERAERELFGAHVARVHGLAYRMTGDSTAAEECVQETFVRAFGGLRDFRGDSSLATWLARLTMRVTLNHLRGTRRRRLREVSLPEHSTALAGETEMDPLVLDRVERAVDSLPLDLRTVLVMNLEGFSHEEIAAALHISVPASRTRLSRARSRLRELLADLRKEIGR